jgi:hypothetical protein
MAPDFSRVCFFGFQEEDVDESARIENAIQENARNAAVTVPPGAGVGGPPDSGPMELAIFVRKLWKPGYELKIRFFSGTEWQQNKVKEHAPQWTEYANIKFTFLDDAASAIPDILIDFNPTKGSWSYLGTDSGYYSSRGEPSMNLGWITDQKTERDIRAVIQHEFGHALGAVHEHESPRANIPWNKKQVYKDLGGPPNMWDRHKVDNNMFTKYSSADVQGTEFDPYSIMLYFYPKEWTTDHKGTRYNTELSQHDKDYIKFCYPPKGLDAGQFNTMEVQPLAQPAKEHQKRKVLHQRYPSIPGLVVGLNWLDIDAGHNIRVKAQALSLDQEKFIANINVWSDTVLYSAGMTWLEIGPRFQFVQCGTFDTNGISLESQLQAQNSKTVTFSTPFHAPPKVVCFLQSVDMGKGKNWRVRAYPSDITDKSFKINIDSWADTVLYHASASWIAYPAEQPGVASGRFSTGDIRPWDEVQKDNSSTVEFSQPFSKAPKVFMALDELDYDAAKNLRLRLSTSEISPTGLRWHLQTWSDSVMYQAGASYFLWEV